MAAGNRTQWSSGFGFVLAAVGSAVGLGNIWKFPYMTHSNGGGLFVLVYLLAVFIVAFPIVIAEMSLGRSARLNAMGTFKKLSKNSPFWKGLGLLCIFSSMIIFSYYSVVAGWTIDYFIESITGSLHKLSANTTESHFIGFLGSPWKQVGFHSFFMFITAFIVLRGTSGIEKAVKIMMPALGIMIFIIASISIYNYGISDTWNFLFNFNLAQLNSSSVLEAVGQAFFSLSLGLGCILVYGSYLPKDVSLVKSGIWIVVFDTLIAIMACFMMYPIIFGTNMEIKQSATILFTSLTVQFNQLPGGAFISAIFYLLVAFAALTSTISLLEPVVSFVHETFDISRKKATIWCSVTIWFIGIGSALANGASLFFTKLAVMDRLDSLTANWTLPIGGMLIAIFTGWFFSKEKRLAEFNENERKYFVPVWTFVIKFLSPILVCVVICYKLGLFH